MKALVIPRFGGPNVLEVQDRPTPAVAPGEIRVDVARAGVNFSDLSARQGLYPDAPPLPMVVGYEVAGTVSAVGEGVSNFRNGDRVVAVTRFNGQAQQVALPTPQAFHLPASVTWDQAAALPVSYLTAYHVVHTVAHLQPGSRVLIHMAAGGLGLALIALCRQVADVELFGTASASKHGLLREAGLHHPIDYHTEDYAERVRALSPGRGLDLVVDPLGGASWKKGYQLLAPTGRLVCCGWANMTTRGRRSFIRVIRELIQMPRFSPIQLMGDNRMVGGVNMAKLFDHPEPLRQSMEELLAQVVDGRLRPHVDRVFPLAEGAQAHRFLEEGRNVGKVLLDCSG